MSYPLVFLGQPLLDISVVVSRSFLNEFNLNENDMILAGEEHGVLYKRLEAFGPSFSAGGSEQNSARGAQWLLPANSTCHIGSVGKDVMADKLKEAASVDGLAVEYVVEKGMQTGKCAVLITGQQRSMVTDLQASSMLREAHIREPAVWSLVENSRIIYSAAFSLKDSSCAVLAVAKHAAENGKLFAFNLSAPWIPFVCKKQMEEILPYCDYLFGNESEAKAYAKANDLKTQDVSEIALHLANLPRLPLRPARVVVITQGPDPVIVATTTHGTREFTVPFMAVSDIVDTNGAGDGFCGGFLAGLVKERSLESCVKTGLMVAHEVLKQQGATYPKERPVYMPWGEWRQGSCCSMQ
ncbi:hypothetical protein HDU98_006664 [Podochytrium sp. JEL0797]|nr:hypothetical protein HDU98_006664 [Podochytrium sp. JEL0797]